MNNLPLTVLFLSTENAVRSQIAEALLRHKGGARFVARSAGYRPMAAVDPRTLEILSTAGISTDRLHTKNWIEFFAAPSVFRIDVIVTLSEEARAHAPQWHNNPVRVHWPVDDPLSADKADVMEWKFRKCFSTLENRITAFVKSRMAQNPFELLLQLKDMAMVGAG